MCIESSMNQVIQRRKLYTGTCIFLFLAHLVVEILAYLMIIQGNRLAAFWGKILNYFEQYSIIFLYPID